MPHDHHGQSQDHGHGHVHLDPASGDRRVSLAIWANGLLTIAQIVGGILSGSLALIADALHNLSDMAALVIAFGARKFARRPADDRMTFGYARVEVVAALINYTTLILIGLFLVYEGAMRLIDPPEVGGWIVVIVAGVALIIDALTALLIWSMQKGSVNMRALFLHNLSDALGSVAVMVGGTLIILYDMRWVDPVITIGIAVYILWLSFAEIGKPIRTLMLGAPDGIDSSAVIAALRAVPGVADVHHVHLWQMQENSPALDCHVIVTAAEWDNYATIKAEIKTMLRQSFGIAHASLDCERADEVQHGTTLIGCGA